MRADSRKWRLVLVLGGFLAAAWSAAPVDAQDGDPSQSVSEKVEEAVDGAQQKVEETA